jgi:pyruvate ferredoxin oxidoreductase alpha subunit
MIRNTKIAMTGGQAMAYALKQINPDVMPVYPITPQTPIIENFAKYQAERLVDTEIITVESEHSAISAAVGSSAAGARTVTATSSQGLALMNEILYIASGMRLPIFMAVSARALSAPLNIHNDHSDVMGARDAGWVQLFAENVQEAYDNTIIGLKLAESSQIPVMSIMDGFITSHSVENLETIPDEAVKKIVGEFNPEQFLLDVDNPVAFGVMALPPHYFDFKADQEKAMRGTLENYKKITEEFSAVSGRLYGVSEAYRTEDAEHIIVLAGSTAGTAKEAVDQLREKGERVGLLKIKLFRPFPHAEISAALFRARSVAVLDKAMSFGTYPPFYTEIITSLHANKITRPEVGSYVYGLGGRDIFVTDIIKVFEDMIKGEISKEIKYIGIKKDE